MHAIYSENIPGHLHRGYILLNENGKLCSHVEVSLFRAFMNVSDYYWQKIFIFFNLAFFGRKTARLVRIRRNGIAMVDYG